MRSSTSAPRVNTGDAGGLEDLERAIEIASAAGSSDVARASNNLSVSVWSWATCAVATSSWRERWRTAAASDSPASSDSPATSSSGLFRIGRWDDALEAEEVPGSVRCREPHYHEGGMRLRRALVRLARDDVDGALEDARKVMTLTQSAGDPQQRVPWLSGCARLLVDAGRRDEARPAARGCFGRSPWLGLFAISRSSRGSSGATRRSPRIISSTARRDEWTDAARGVLRGDFARAAEILAEIGDAELGVAARLRAAERLVAEVGAPRRTSSSRRHSRSGARSARSATSEEAALLAAAS